MGKTKIIKIKRKSEDDGFSLEIDWTEQNSSESAPEPNWRKPRHLIHDDLATALQDLYVHMAVLSGYFKPADIDKDLLDKRMPLYKSIQTEYDFIPHGYSIGGEPDNPTVVISGHIVIWSSEEVQINTPPTLLDDEDYILSADLRTKIDVLEDEVIKYLNGDKFKPTPQQSLFPEDEKVTHAQIAGPEKKPLFKKDKPELSEFSLPVDDQLREKVKRGRRKKDNDEDTDPDLAA